jgi:hypothetical protein
MWAIAGATILNLLAACGTLIILLLKNVPAVAAAVPK